MTTKGILLLLGVLVNTSIFAAQYDIPNNSNIVGKISSVTARKGDTLNRVAIRNGLGYNEMISANPKWKGRNIPSGTTLTLPKKHTLPSANQSGIVINVSDMRLFYYPPEGGKVITFPIAVGKRGWSTPTGKTTIIGKRKNPTWTPPVSIRKEAAKKGKKLRKVYPAGPNNPLGTRALRLGLPGYLIHGTNKPWSIGKRASHGCIRMRKADIEKLYSMVPVNTSVTIVSEKNRINDHTASSHKYVKKQPKKSSSSKKKSTASHSSATQPTKKSYVSENELDFSRLQNDIQSGVSTPIDLSGI